jgi:hypothetical protein
MLIPERYHRGACVFANWELRITQRCLTSDLSLGAGALFKNSTSHPIVQAFESKRSAHTGEGKTVGPAAGQHTLHHLGIGNDHRGATWFQPAAGVVWLCAYRFHRSHTDDDFFKWVKPLIDDRSLFPASVDIDLLVRERALRFRHMAPVHARELMDEARASGRVVVGRLAWEIDVRVKVEASGEEELVSVAFPGNAGSRSTEIASAFDPRKRLTPDWREELPGEKRVPEEIAFTVLRTADDALEKSEDAGGDTA